MPGAYPPILENTKLAGELVRVVKLPIWNETALLGEPNAPELVAKRLTVDDGQNQLALGPVQFRRWLDKGGVRNSPFEPLSIKLLYVFEGLPILVENSPVFGLAG